MWKVEESLQGYLKAAHRLTADLLNWAWQHRAPGGDDTVLGELAGRARLADDPLGVVAAATDLCVYMGFLAVSPHLHTIRRDYFRITRDYRGFLAAGAELELRGPARDVAKTVFRYLYDQVLESRTFWDQYDPGRADAFTNKGGYQAAFRRSRPVCPICDFTKTTVLSTSEHFLSEASFPVVGVFWLNLVLGCTVCNSGGRQSKFIGTEMGQPSSNIPICHPFFDQVAEHIQFRFGEKYKPLPPIAVAPRASDRIRAANYCNVYAIGARYADDQADAKGYAEDWKDRFRTRFEREAAHKPRTRDLLREVVNEVEARVRDGLLEDAGKRDKVKFKLDLLAHVAGQVEVLGNELGLP